MRVKNSTQRFQAFGQDLQESFGGDSGTDPRSVEKSAGERCRTADGGPSRAFEKVYSRARHQRCWVHKTRNILEKVRRREEG